MTDMTEAAWKSSLLTPLIWWEHENLNVLYSSSTLTIKVLYLHKASVLTLWIKHMLAKVILSKWLVGVWVLVWVLNRRRGL